MLQVTVAGRGGIRTCRNLALPATGDPRPATLWIPGILPLIVALIALSLIFALLERLGAALPRKTLLRRERTVDRTGSRCGWPKTAGDGVFPIVLLVDHSRRRRHGSRDSRSRSRFSSYSSSATFWVTCRIGCFIRGSCGSFTRFITARRTSTGLPRRGSPGE